MLKEIKFILIYFACFIGLPMLGIKLFDKNPNEMLGFVLWGGLFYAACCFIPWIIINKISLFIKSNILRYIARFFAGLLVLYLFIILVDSSAGTMDFRVCVGMHVVYTLSFIIASARYGINSSREVEPEPEV